MLEPGAPHAEGDFSRFKADVVRAEECLARIFAGEWPVVSPTTLAHHSRVLRQARARLLGSEPPIVQVRCDAEARDEWENEGGAKVTPQLLR